MLTFGDSVMWKRRSPELTASCEAGKNNANKMVEKRLFERAIGV